ncbi:hypothetical protein [Moorena sp. SIO3I6]|uniref:hypothetical protein n=1 Tax=Moorena sp. SIO3I6 TaxID=2607831 RepID=UPI0013FB72DB|nr:hypothetical protein [Moorena sp. SIO3I6]NEP24766.1 hypothetical protein [Moorena sp. SIO3I6]
MLASPPLTHPTRFPIPDSLLPTPCSHKNLQNFSKYAIIKKFLCYHKNGDTVRRESV